MPKLTEKQVEQLSPRDEEYCVWDTEVVGLGVRIRPSGAKSFVLMYRRGGKQRKHTMGKLDVGYGVKEARERAKDLLRGLRDGVDPQDAKVEERNALTVAELADLYLELGPALKPEKKQSSWDTDRGLFRNHVKPLIGRMLAREVTKVDVATMQLDISRGKTARNEKTGPRRRSVVKGGKRIASMAVAVLGACFQWGIETGRVSHNPTRTVKAFKINRRERYLSEKEVACFSEAIADWEREDPRMAVRRVAEDLGQPELQWVATCHYDTDQPHAHVLVRGKRASGKDLVIPRDYIGYGFRARAQEVAQERLGDLSRADAERRIWRETEANRFTGFDRRLLSAADQDGLVEDGVGGSDAWAALTRGRLRHLERLGLAAPAGRRYRLAADLELKLRTLQIRQDVIRTLNQRRLEGARKVQQLGEQKVRGRLVRAGSHDELGGAQYVIVRDREGTEHYAQLAFGRSAPKLGSQVDLVPGPRGAQLLGLGRSTQDQGL